MREIVLDTETTGMNPDKGDRIIEIGCVALDNHIPTGETLQIYIQPERDVPADAVSVHGITNEFLKDKPTFIEVYSDFTDFIKDAKLVIHNAAFDMKFINHHLKSVGAPQINWDCVVDTLDMARRKFPGSPASLDALCRRFGIDNTERTYHGALLDSELLAEVYLELLGGRQHIFGLNDRKNAHNAQSQLIKKDRPFREPREFAPSEDDLANHAALLEKLNDPMWKKYG